MVVLVIKALISLAFIIVVIFLCSKFIKKYTKFGKLVTSNNDTRAKIISISYIDDSSKVVILNALGNNYILAMNKNHIVVLDKQYNDISTFEEIN